MNQPEPLKESSTGPSASADQPSPAVQPPNTGEATERPPVHLGHAASTALPPPRQDSELSEFCAYARQQKRSVSILVRDPADVQEVERLMEGYDHLWIVRVVPHQNVRTLLRSL